MDEYINDVIMAAKELIDTTDPWERDDLGLCIACDGDHNSQTHEDECPWHILAELLERGNDGS